MPSRFCSHLEEYGIQFIRTEGAYQAFNTMVDRAVQEKDDQDLRQSLVKAMEDWQRETKALREKFLELYHAGKIQLPNGALAKGNPHGSGATGMAKCRECHQEIPRLEFSEWQLAHNGAVNFRGEELDLDEPELTIAP